MRHKLLVAATALVGTVVLSSEITPIAQQTPLGGQQPPAGQPGQAQPDQGRRGGGGGGPQAIPFEDRTGFQPIFDGTSLKGWDGDPTYWKAQDGAIVGETTEATALKENTFIIYRGSEPADFELKVEFRLGNTNSGVQYRSTHLPPGTPSGDSTVQGKWVLKGYQADIDIANRFTGMLYEERGRGFLAPRGTLGYASDAKRGSIGALEDGEALKAYIKEKDWNQFHVIARGGTLIHILNRHVTAAFVDDDAKNRSLKGLLGFQAHTGPPMKVEFRNILLKTL
jgi:hypothetical protein